MEENKKWKISLFDIAVLTSFVFLILRLAGVVTWAWYIILLPLFAYVGLILFALILMLQIFLIVTFIEARDEFR